ncbi:pentapeptide repeat-containing protein [Mesorhizobium sp. M0589]|uniref:pentapeptide repeat-containing protein n=1 Tax=Mesorhizobium sp. M0589 TaxID=2956965 RepID=UPI0033391BE6
MRSWLAAVGVLLLVVLALAISLYAEYDNLSPYFQGVAVESAGVLIEVVLLLAAFGLYEKIRGRNEDIRRLRDRISDFKRVDDAHAHSIIASSVRQLAEHGLTDIDFRGMHLHGFSFSRQDISSLRGSMFSTGLDFSKPSRAFTELTDVDFTDLDCRDVKFGTGNLSLATYKNCQFWNANLQSASFDGVRLWWDEASVKADESDWREKVDETEDGEPIFADVYSPAFHRSDLKGTSFRETSFDRADFRGADNVLSADFTKARGLETCFFDEEIRDEFRRKWLATPQAPV